MYVLEHGGLGCLFVQRISNPADHTGNRQKCSGTRREGTAMDDSSFDVDPSLS